MLSREWMSLSRARGSGVGGVGVSGGEGNIREGGPFPAMVDLAHAEREQDEEVRSLVGCQKNCIPLQYHIAFAFLSTRRCICCRFGVDFSGGSTHPPRGERTAAVRWRCVKRLFQSLEIRTRSPARGDLQSPTLLLPRCRGFRVMTNF